ncbi:hypothetical protein SD70_15925 [Gordoniibacillus kamchatkensis]|uniref:Uncharacterized protein n=1 Tax=Gordoniibacillus kamchatkensis TaxID=1590651 RepID=A0ABR5AGC2_9BACL|nr:hypothetical protein SD70_15925 [Paenibacillus sp. VKM B-2647]
MGNADDNGNTFRYVVFVLDNQQHKLQHKQQHKQQSKQQHNQQHKQQHNQQHKLQQYPKCHSTLQGGIPA